MKSRFLIVVSLLLVAGCSRDLPDMVEVRGTVTFDGGPCPAEGRIFFGPIKAAPGFSLRPAAAVFGTDGVYQVESFRNAAGLVPGRYEISIQCWEVEPDEDGKPGKSYVPGNSSRRVSHRPHSRRSGRSRLRRASEQVMSSHTSVTSR